MPFQAPFVGRTELLRRLDEVISAAYLASCKIVGIVGPAGVGKTRLLDHFATAQAHSKGPMVTLSAATNGERCVLLGAIEAAIRKAAPDPDLTGRLRLALRDMAGELGAMSPLISGMLGDPAPPGPAALPERFTRRVGALADAVSAIGTASRPLLLIIDDIDRADALSAAVLRVLQTGKRDHYTTVVVSGRTVEPLDEEFVVGSLGVDDLAEVVRQTAMVDASTARQTALILERAGGGNPFRSWTLLGEWIRNGAFSGANAPLPVIEHPDDDVDVVRLLHHRLKGLTPDARHVLSVAAALTGPVDREWFAEVLGWQPERVTEASDTLLASGLALSTPEARIVLPHQTIRDLVLETIGPERMRASHLRIAHHLAGQDAEPGQVCRHLEHGTPAGTDHTLARGHLMAGTEALTEYALRPARWHFSKALLRSDRRDVRLDSLEGLADAAVLLGDTEAAAAAALEVIRGAQASTARKVRLAGRLVYALFRQNDRDAAIAVAHAALRASGEPIATTTFRSIYVGLVAWVKLALFTPQKEPQVRTALCHLYSMMIPVLAASQPQLIPSVALPGAWNAKGLSTPHAVLSRAFYAAMHAALRSREAWSERYDGVEAEALETGDEWVIGVVHHLRGESEIGLGNYAEGKKRLESARRYFSRTGDHSITAISLIIMATYGKWRETRSQCEAWLNDAREITLRQQHRYGRHTVEAMRMEIEQRRGVVDRAELLALSDRLLSTDGGGTSDAVLTDTAMIQALAREGDLARATKHHKRVHDLVQSLPPGLPPVLMDVYAATAELMLRQEVLTQNNRVVMASAISQLKKAGRSCPRMKAAYELYSGRLAARSGQFALARSHFETLIAGASDHGQRLLAAEAHEHLASLLAGKDILAAGQHTEAAAAMRREPAPLGHSEPERREARTITGPHPPPPDGSVIVRDQLAALVPRLEAALDPGLALQVDLPPPALATRGWPNGFRYVVVSLVLVGRDAMDGVGTIRLQTAILRLDQRAASRIPGAYAGSFVTVELSLRGPHVSSPNAALSGCRQALDRLDGFLRIEERDGSLIITAYMPPAVGDSEDSPARRALVIHPDDRIRNAVVNALQGLGYLVRESEEPIPVDAASVVFAPPDVSKWPPGVHVIFLVGRERGGPGKLRYPFTFDQLTRLLADASDDASETGSPTG